MAINWIETDVKYGGSPYFQRCIGYEEIGRDANGVSFRIYLRLKVYGSSSSFYGYGINWRVDGGGWLKVKDASPRWYGNEGYREFSTTLWKPAGASGGSTSFSVQVDGLGGSCDYTANYTAYYSTFNTAPWWSDGARLRVRENNPSGYLVAEERWGTENAVQVREDVGTYYVSWDSASDNDGNINRYELYGQVSEGAWSLLYSGGAREFYHYVGEGASTQGRSYDYYVVAVDSYGERSGSLDTTQFQKNTLTGANPSVSNGIEYATSEFTLWWDGARNTNGNGTFSYRVNSPHIKVYNIEKLTASGGKIKILKEGTSTDPYISFEELRVMASNYNYETYIDLQVITRNAYGSESTKSVRVWINIKTDPQPPTSIVVGGHTSTNLGAYLIPSRNKPTVSWSGAYDKLKGSLTYDVYFKIGNGAETLISAGSNTKVTLPISNVSASATLSVRVMAKTWYGRQKDASNSSETLHYYNPPSVYMSNPKRTITSFVVDIHSQINTSIPKVAFSKQRYTGNGTTKDFTGTKYTATLTGLQANSTFDFTAIVCDNTGLSTDQQAVFKVVPAIPKFSVRENGVGVNCINETNKILAVDGGANIKGGMEIDGIDIKETKRYGYRHITVGGDANKYYPVRMWINGVWGFPTNRVSIGRSYDWDAPSSWNTATHKGGLTLTYRWAGDTSWGGNSREIIVEEFSETYCKMVGGMRHSTNGMIVWLRGGGALYEINNDWGNKLLVEVNLETYMASNGETFPVRDYNANAVTDEILNRYPLRTSGQEIYARNIKLDNNLSLGTSSDTISHVRTSRDILFASGKYKLALGANVYFDGANDVHFDPANGAGQIVLDRANYPKFRWSYTQDSQFGITKWSAYYNMLTDYEGQQVVVERGTVTDGANWNNFENGGVYQVACPNYSSNQPPNSYYYGVLTVLRSQGCITQFYTPHNGSHFMQYRVRYNSGVWTNWANVGWSAYSTLALNTNLMTTSLREANRSPRLTATNLMAFVGDVPTETEEPIDEGFTVKHPITEKPQESPTDVLVNAINVLDNRVKELEALLEEKSKGGA